MSDQKDTLTTMSNVAKIETGISASSLPLNIFDSETKKEKEELSDVPLNSIPKLRFFWDINKTIMNYDSADNQYTAQQLANEDTARCSDGHSTSRDWLACQKQGCLTEHITYYKHQIKVFNPNGGDANKGYKEKAFVFTEAGQPGECFRNIYTSYLENGRDIDGNPTLFKSFLKTFHENRSAVHCLYTFGEDGPICMRLLKTYCEVHGLALALALAGFSQYKLIWIDDLPHVEVQGQMLSMDQFNALMYRSMPDTLFLLVADFKKWNGSKKNPVFGKAIEPCWYLPTIAFDDNANTCMPKNQKNFRVFHINPFEAMTNVNYYEKLINT